jgi:hypothetical protein
MSAKRDSAVQVQIRYQPDPQRMVRALLLLLGLGKPKQEGANHEQKR